METDPVVPTLEDAIALALRAHRGQVDKAGEPYVLHPLRLLARFRDRPAQLTAVLHDVVEDSSVTLADLRADGYPEAVVAAVECLTRRAGESYEAFIARLAENPLAQRVKLADLEDNLDVRRLPAITEADQARLERYRRAWHHLTSGA